MAPAVILFEEDVGVPSCAFVSLNMLESLARTARFENQVCSVRAAWCSRYRRSRLLTVRRVSIRSSTPG
jgi:hypothetical protein